MRTHRIISLMLAASLAASAVLAGCGNAGKNESNKTSSKTQASEESAKVNSDGSLVLPKNGGFDTVTYQFSDDKYKTYYEIFPYSFYDSDGSGIGDLNGITAKLDYLNDGDPKTTDDLGIDGIWLMPIMQSPSYHKYNVADYMTVDKDYGTNDDFKKLLDEAHKRHIDVIIDLVINHTSRQHEWYQKAIEELKAGKTDGYVQYYHFKQDHKAGGWNSTGVDNWYYESQFDSDMPDLNLQNEKVREELQKIVKYWLDTGVDGFRLDAVWWFESEIGIEESIADLKWLYDYAKTVKPDVYMVGECWKDSVTISDFYKSGVDSFFNFTVQGGTGRINKDVNTSDAQDFVNYLQKWQDQIRQNNPDAIDCPFLSNHDTGRSAGYVATMTSKRLNAALYLTSPGNPFIYYGEEICMKGNQNDPDKRRGMYWSKDDDTGYVKRIPGASTGYKPPEESVEEALKNKDSLVNFYKRVIALRNQNPEIARGKMKAVEFADKTSVAGYVTEYQDSKVMVIYNLAGKTADVEIPEDTFKPQEVRGYLLAAADDAELEEGYKATTYDDPQIKVKGQKVTLPPYSVIVLK